MVWQAVCVWPWLRPNVTTTLGYHWVWLCEWMPESSKNSAVKQVSAITVHHRDWSTELSVNDTWNCALLLRKTFFSLSLLIIRIFTFNVAFFKSWQSVCDLVELVELHMNVPLNCAIYSFNLKRCFLFLHALISLSPLLLSWAHIFSS